MAEAVGKVTAFDRLGQAFNDGIALVPLAGPVIAAVARQVLPQDTLLYVHDFAVEAARRIEALEDRRDLEHLASTDFREDAEQIFDAQVRLNQRRKREYFLAALTNAAASDRPEDAERRRFIDALISLRPSHLRLLAFVMNADTIDPKAVERAEWFLHENLRGLSPEVIRLDWRDLESEGLLAGWPGGLTSTPIPQFVRSRVMPLGERFARFVSVGG